jgi:hypothetical protein
MRIWLLYPKWFRTIYSSSLKINGVAILVLVAVLLLAGIAWLFGRLIHIGG